MTPIYADTSVLARAYLADEAEHAALRARLLEGDAVVLTSELARVELASAVMAAARDRRVEDAERLLARIDADCGEDGPLVLVPLRPGEVLPLASRIVRDSRLRTLDALHLAVASLESRAMELVLMTRDREQANAARALGLAIA